MIPASRELSNSFLLAFPPPAAAGEFFRQEVLPEEVPCVLLTQKERLQEHQKSPE